MTTKPDHLLIDGDIIAYQAASAVEVPTDWGGGLWTLHSDLNAAIDKAVSSIQSMWESSGATSVALYFTEGDNWRKTVLPTYKSNRKKTRKPLVLAPLREFLRSVYTCHSTPGMEADDLLGATLTCPHVTGTDAAIVSIDKDLGQIPGLHWSEARGTYLVTWQEGDYLHMLQTLTGDTTDGYSGCPGVGPVKAQKILGAVGEKTLKEMWDAVVATFVKAGLPPEEALVQARVAKIAQWENIDQKTGMAIPWTPPTI